MQPGQRVRDCCDVPVSLSGNWYSPTLNWDVFSSTSVCSSTSFVCRMPKEFWIPKMEPLHQVAASTTTQPNPPSGGANSEPCPCLSAWLSTSESEAGGSGESGCRQSASITWTVLTSGTSVPAVWSLLFSSASCAASLPCMWGSAEGSSVLHTPPDGCPCLSNPLIPMLSGVALSLLQWVLGAHASDIGHIHKSTGWNQRSDWSINRQVFLLLLLFLWSASERQLQRIWWTPTRRHQVSFCSDVCLLGSASASHLSS